MVVITGIIAVKITQWNCKNYSKQSSASANPLIHNANLLSKWWNQAEQVPEDVEQETHPVPALGMGYDCPVEDECECSVGALSPQSGTPCQVPRWCMKIM